MRRIPVVATLIVVAAAAAMVALGVWQLHRLAQKQAMLARYAANAGLPPIAFPTFFPPDDKLLFRRASAFCLAPASWRAEAGRSVADRPGWKHIAACRTGAEGPGFLIDMGVSDSFESPRGWKGGPVSGVIAPAPSHHSLIAGLFHRYSRENPMIVADVAAPGLEPSARPSPADIPNNHLAYAVQWFVFAALALVIYALALRSDGSRSPGDDQP